MTSVMDRRTFLAGSGAVLLAAPLAVEAQQAGKVYRIGFLANSSAAQKPSVEQFRQGLRQLGYIEGQNIIIEYRWAEGQLDRLPELATDLARIAPDLIVRGGGPVRCGSSQRDNVDPHRHGPRG